jgi:hypothetical protein
VGFSCDSRNEKTSIREHGVCRHRSCQLIQQRLRVFQVRRIETLCEPLIDRTEQITGFGALALVAPEAGALETRGAERALSSPPRYTETARLAASRLSFFCRSTLLRGIIEGATTMQSSPNLVWVR